MANRSPYYNERVKAYKNKFQKLRALCPPFLHPYLLDLEQSKEIRTAIAYAQDLITFLQFLQDFSPLCKDLELKDIPLDAIRQLTFQDINEFKDYLSSSERHANRDISIRRKISALRGFYDFECSHGYLETNPMNQISKFKKIKDQPIVRLTVDEANTLVQKIATSDIQDSRRRKHAEHTQLRDTAIVMLLLGTGIRISECAALSITDINFREQKIPVVRKGDKDGEVYFNADVADALLSYIEEERPLYCKTENEPALFLSNRKQRMAVRSIQEMLRKCGLEHLGKGNLHPHTLRKTYGTLLYETTEDILYVQDALGHQDGRTTSKYYIDRTGKQKRNRDMYLYKKEAEDQSE